ncbi:MAG TPA: mycothiol synthase [Acidimicrobiales bacterium]
MDGLGLVVVSEPTPALRRSVEALSARVEAATGHAPLSEHQRMVLARSSWAADGGGGDGHPAFGVLAAGADRVEPVGYAQLSGDRDRGEFALELLVDPRTPQPTEVSDALLGAALDQVAAVGGSTVRLWLPQAGDTGDALAARHRFHRERDLLQMRCRLPLPPVGHDAPGLAVATRPFRPGLDERAWLDTNNRAFASHPEQGHWDLDTLVAREKEEWFDPEGFLVLETEGRMAGFCWTKVHARTEPPMGEIYVIGVDPDFRGRGWGRALTRAGLDWLAAHGRSVGMLYVDADNLAAVSLYRSLGFVEDHVDRAYVRSVAGA